MEQIVDEPMGALYPCKHREKGTTNGVQPILTEIFHYEGC